MVLYLRNSGSIGADWEGSSWLDMCDYINSHLPDGTVSIAFQQGASFNTGDDNPRNMIGDGVDGSMLQVQMRTWNYNLPSSNGPATITGRIKFNITAVPPYSTDVTVHGFHHIVDNIPDGHAPIMNMSNGGVGGGGV